MDHDTTATIDLTDEDRTMVADFFVKVGRVLVSGHSPWGTNVIEWAAAHDPASLFRELRSRTRKLRAVGCKRMPLGEAYLWMQAFVLLTAQTGDGGREELQLVS